jgi:endonuclease/exonuclease/phosphatase family metal-dependent hydrolase
MSHETRRWILCLLLAPALLGCHSTAGRAIVADRTLESRPTDRLCVGPLDEIRVLLINLQLLPPPVGHTRADRRRVKDFVRGLLSTNAPHDVLLFTEVFNEDLRAELADLLAADYPYQVPKCEEEIGLRQDSGLCLFSRFPIRREKGRALCAFLTFPFALTWTADMFAAKGVLGVALDVGGGRDLWVFLTHLQSDSVRVGEFRTVRADQLRVVRAFIAECLEQADPARVCAVVLAGDMNVDGLVRPHSEWTAMTRLLGRPRDVHVATGTAEATWNPVLNSRIGPTDARPQRLDYIFVYDAFSMPGLGCRHGQLLALRVEDCGIVRPRNKEGDISDHYGLVARFAVPGRSGSASIEVAAADLDGPVRSLD